MIWLNEVAKLCKKQQKERQGIRNGLRWWMCGVGEKFSKEKTVALRMKKLSTAWKIISCCTQILAKMNHQNLLLDGVV